MEARPKVSLRPQLFSPRTTCPAGILAAIAALTPVAVLAQASQPADRVQTIDHSIEGYISDDAMQLQYVRQLVIEDFGPIEARGGVFYNEDRDLIAIGDALVSVRDEPGTFRSLQVRVGTRVYGAFLNVENQDVFGASIGGEADYFFSRDGRTSVKLFAFYSPDILTFGEADNVKDVGLRLTTRLRSGLDLFVGYRSFEIDTSLGDREVDDNMHVGFRRSF